MKGIVYYTKDGSTGVLAEVLTELNESAKVIQLKEKKNRKGISGFISGGFQAATKKGTKLIGEPWNDLEGITEMYLCTPIWAGNGTPAMNEFLNRTDLTGILVTIITLMADPALKNIEQTHEYLSKRVKEQGGNVEKCIAMHGASPGKCADKDYILQQIKKN